MTRMALTSVAWIVLTICALDHVALSAEESDPRTGGDRPVERAVAAALDWLSRHQMPDGHWSLSGHSGRCKDGACTGSGAAMQADTAATAMGLLPFLAADQTPASQRPYQRVVGKGIRWLVQQQKPDGDLRGDSSMYAHGWAAIVLCEAYGMTKDKETGAAAQKAVDFIQAAQHKEGGGWRYAPGMEGDTSVLGWQVAALRSAQLAGLKVSKECLDGARKYLKSAAAGEQGEMFKYTPGLTTATPTMTAVGLLCSQHLGAQRSDPQMVAGAKRLMGHLPDPRRGPRNVYFWYYATQVMHNAGGADWKTWNENLRKTLVESQVLEGCAKGSWDPALPVQDTWGNQGGRLMTTSLSALSLAVYYRYLPLYKPAAAPGGGARTEPVLVPAGE